jgi:tRNA threonylcarbamoyladenosine biosynthesis protein TsaB
MLALETSSLVASVAVTEDHLLLADFVLQHPMTHSQKLMPMLDQALHYLGLTIPDFDAIAVTIGPGSFTGLRIGVSAAKGLAQPHGIGVIPVSSLKSTAYNAFDSRRIVAVMMDARRNEYYAGAWRFGETGLQQVTEEAAWPVDNFAQSLLEACRREKTEVLLLGDGAAKAFERMALILGDRVALAPAEMRCQRASSVAMCARLEAIAPVRYDAVKMNYLRRPEAEVTREQRLKG